MSAEVSLLRFEDEPDDPNEILQLLPAEQREEFTQEYQDAWRAASEPNGYADLRRTLWHWRLRAVVYSDPSQDHIPAIELADRLARYSVESWAVHATAPSPWFRATILRILIVAAGSGAKSVVPLADSLTRTWARLGVEESLAHRQWPHVIEVDEQDALDKAIGVEQSLPHKQWHDSIEADEQEALDEAFVAAARRSMAEYIAELSAERAIGGVASQKGSSTAPQPNSRQNGSDRPTLDEVLDRIGTRHGGEIGFEEAVNIIESERNNR